MDQSAQLLLGAEIVALADDLPRIAQVSGEPFAGARYPAAASAACRLAGEPG